MAVNIEPAPPALSLTAVFLRFLRFGLLAFGGPVAQIAMIRRELVDQDRWMSSARFNRLLAVLQVLPGPEAHELCVHMGMRARGRIGGLLAGLGFMLPGLILMLGIGWAYVALSPVVGLLAGAFLGVQAAVVAVIVRAVCKIGSHILEDRWLWAVAVVGFAATLAGAAFWIVLAAGGAAYVLVRAGRVGLAGGVTAMAGVAALAMHGLGDGGPVFGQTAGQGGDGGWVAMFWTGLKAGLLTFGGAYTAIPYVRADTVGRGLIDDGAFLDGIAFAGVIPAPLVIFCTFVGFVVAGWGGALAMTAGVFAPAFAFSMIFYERLEAVVEDRRLHDGLAGVAAAVVGIIAATSVELGWATLQRAPSMAAAVAIFAVALAVAWAWKSRYAVPAVLAAAAVVGWGVMR
ncbi:chromate efflux transporter [Brevundimonas sp. BT-123]|uniref:chromate efflux transporter n=1 Tax=Brevundimonas sp. BT-123 TaxID=2986928 RepID=UPI0022360F81|nr:chromate efflux transporter [Brevundimonas sp. BT-123]MCW0045919.1 chromate efflux transporter [Brevundimonas sp. BT-123]